MTIEPQLGFPEITPKQVRAAHLRSERSGERVLDLLKNDLGQPDSAFVLALAQVIRIPAISLADLRAAVPRFDLIGMREAVTRGVLAIDLDGRTRIVLADPFDRDLGAWIDSVAPPGTNWMIAQQKDISEFLSLHEKDLPALDRLQVGDSDVDVPLVTIEDLSLRSIVEGGSSVVRLVNSTLYDAFKAGASDIHLESVAEGLIIRYRLDGVLSTVTSKSGVSFAEQVISRIKVMSDLDIAEQRVPQDGRFKVKISGRAVDCRVSIMPSIYGEDAVVRILDRRTLTTSNDRFQIEDLGFDADITARFRRLVNEPYGMVLVTGPTGSGKTTTLYAAISEINNGQDKIVTIEDPVEYQLPGVLQIPVNEKKGLTFVRGLRSILRHDPDKIMVGEIRDPETAQIALQSALTGHLVLTTVHANNVFDVLGRFLHMGIDPYSLVSALNGSLAQRLVRQVCEHCAAEEQPGTRLLEDSGISASHAKDFHFRIGRGCNACRGTGYKGRKAIGEMLILNDNIREMIVNREPIRKIKEVARQGGTRYLRESALTLVRNGETTLQEINRVTFVE